MVRAKRACASRRAAPQKDGQRRLPRGRPCETGPQRIGTVPVGADRAAPAAELDEERDADSNRDKQQHDFEHVHFRWTAAAEAGDIGQIVQKTWRQPKYCKIAGPIAVMQSLYHQRSRRIEQYELQDEINELDLRS